MRRFLLCLVAFVLAAMTVSAQPALMPQPAHLNADQGQLVLNAGFRVALTGYTEPRLTLARDRFLTTLSKQTGLIFAPQVPTSATLTIKTTAASAPVEQLGEDESYHLAITPNGAELSAPNPLGILHGLQTFLQLVSVTPQGFAAPAVTIDDAPRFPWRGLMIDAGRHFQPIPVLERNIDGMEAVKLNVFHWHLSEDQGFRIESKTFPLLTEKGSNGQFYTQSDVHHILDYAHNRGIRVVAEFDMPCHTTAWFAGYPDLASGKGPYAIETHWGVFDPAMDPTRESTFKFLDKFIGEMTSVFPDAYFHIGGDECNGKEWDANPRIQAYIKDHNLKDNAGLQAYFTARVQKIVAAHKKIAIGWDEVLQPNTPKEVVVQSWRGPQGLAAAVKQGNRALLSNGYYIDLNQPASDHYLVDPLSGDAANLTPDEQSRILGGEATMWSEMATPEILDSRIWPRTAAIAERYWSPASVRDVASMYARLQPISEKLESLGLTHRSFTRPMLERITTDPDSLAIFATAVQPPLGYQREEFGPYTSASPLNHLVDATQPESEPARLFAATVDRILAGTASPADWITARMQLVDWRDAALHLNAATLNASAYTAELVPVARNLEIVATLGLQALDDIRNHHTPEAKLAAAATATLKAAEAPQAALRLMPVAPVEKLLTASLKQ
ncbi:MAG: family 20 glycosylhydrolase [Terracidiphilus sp.]|nr:family 20 glycosylhydrolase [Terracidiphilus sp.]